MRYLIRGLVLSLVLAAPLAAQAGVFVSVTIAPPALPVYVAPPMPAPGYFWTPGYWAYADAGYYWVPGTWILAPTPGLLWTPGYWGWGGGAYLWHGGYWGPHVGFYGGVNYGFGYGGVGFNGGGWQGGHYVANTTVINNTTIVNNTTINRVSYNGGTGGIAAQPTAAEARYAQETHTPPSEVQQQHEQAASRDTTMRADYNHGSPSVAATAKPGVFYGHDVTAARAPGAGGGGAPHGSPAGNPTAGGHENFAPHTASAPHQAAGGAPRAPYGNQNTAHFTPPSSGHTGAPGPQHPQQAPHAQTAQHGGGEHGNGGERPHEGGRR